MIVKLQTLRRFVSSSNRDTKQTGDSSAAGKVEQEMKVLGEYFCSSPHPRTFSPTEQFDFFTRDANMSHGYKILLYVPTYLLP